MMKFRTWGGVVVVVALFATELAASWGGPLGRVTVSEDTVVPAGTEIVITRESLVMIRGGAVLDLRGAHLVASPDIGWIDAGGGLSPRDAGHVAFTPFEPRRNIDGGRILFPDGQLVSANWFLPGNGDIGTALTTAAYMVRTGGTDVSLTLVGRHVAREPADLTGWGSSFLRKLFQVDAHIVWSPTAANRPFPFLDFTGSRGFNLRGRLVIEGDAEARPERGVQFARGPQPSHSGHHDVTGLELRGHFTVAAWTFSQAENNFGYGNSIQIDSRVGVPVALVRDPSHANPWGPRSRFQPMNEEVTSFNFARSWNDVVVFARGEDEYVDHVPPRAAVVMEGVTRGTFRDFFVASNIPALLIRPRRTTGNMTSIRIEDFQQHGRPVERIPNPAAAIVIDLTDEGARVDSLALSVSGDSATSESVRIVGTGRMYQPSIVLRSGSSGTIRAYGACQLWGIDFITESASGVVDLSSCRYVSGIIRTANPDGVLLPTTRDGHNVRIEDIRLRNATASFHDRNLVRVVFRCPLAAGAVDASCMLAGTTLATALQPSAGAIVGIAVELDGDLSAGTVQSLRVQRVDAAGRGTTIHTAYTPLESARTPRLHSSDLAFGTALFLARDRLRVLISTDASVRGASEAVVTLVLAVKG